MKKRLKIAIFHLAFFYSGGGEKLVLEEMKGLAERGHEVTCFTPVIEKKSCYPDMIDKFNIKTIFPKLPKILPDQQSLEILLTCMLFPLTARRFRDFDVVLGAGQPGFWFGWLVKKMTGVPYVIYSNQPTRVLYPRKIDKATGIWVKRRSRLPRVLGWLRPLVGWADKVSIRDGDKMLANGEYISGVLKKIYGRENTVCPSGAYPVKKISKDRWAGIIKVNGYTIAKPYILITNRHFPQKRFEYAIKAMPEILKRVAGVSLVITGNRTEYTERLDKLVRKLGLKDKVLLTGLVREKDMQKLYQRAVVYAYTSPEEDFGMGVIEAMAAGVPVVAWDKGGPATTIIDRKTGYLVKPYNQVEFASKLIDLITNKKENLLMGRQAVNHIKKNFTYDHHINILEKALLEVVK